MNPDDIVFIPGLQVGDFNKYFFKVSNNFQNEVNNMKYISGKFMIGSVTKTVTRGHNPTVTEGVSFSANPAVHETWAEAKAEAERLTKAHPDKEFLVVEIKGRAKSVGVEWK